jgi:hypothetical protein
VLLASLLAVISSLAVTAVANAAYQWQSGPLVESQDSNCVTGNIEQEAGAYMSYYFNPAAPPATGQTYYVAVNVAGIGNTCAGIYADIELSLPTGTTLAISPSTPVECFLQFPGTSSYTRDTVDCPQSLGTGALGAGFIGLDPLSNPPFWPLPDGGTVEVNIPVKSTIAGTNQISGTVQLADGESDPILRTYIDSIVDTATQVSTGTEVSISYADPSITSQVIQTSPNGYVNVGTSGTVVHTGSAISGTVYAELAFPSKPGSGQSATLDCANPELSTVSGFPGYPEGTGTAYAFSGATGSVPVNVVFPDSYPGTPFCWRLYADVGGTDYYGNWQFFETIGSTSVLGTKPYPGGVQTTTGTSDCSTNGSGCITSACAGAGTCTACTTNCLTTFSPPKPTPTPTPPPAPSPVAPTVTGAGQSHDKWKDGNALAVISKTKHHKAHGPPVGTTFTFSLNESAAVTMTFQDKVKGRTVGGKCVAETHANKRKPSCSTEETAGSLSFTGHSGTNTVVFDGRVSATDKLKPGDYTVAIAATSSALTATPASLSFTIAK